MTDKIAFLVAYVAFGWGVLLAIDLPELWDENTLNAFFISIPCFTVLAFIAKDAAHTHWRRH